MQTENETTAPESPKIRELPRDRHLSLVSPWVDVTSFSQNAKDRTPRTWNAKFGRFNLVLTLCVYDSVVEYKKFINNIISHKEL